MTSAGLEGLVIRPLRAGDEAAFAEATASWDDSSGFTWDRPPEGVAFADWTAALERHSRGVAKRLLAEALRVCASLGIERALVTCDDDNPGSIRVIEGAGGVFQDHYPVGDGKAPKRRYWIDLPATPVSTPR